MTPMKWDEFKKMPEDLQKTYITCLRNQFGVPSKKLEEMFGVSHCAVSAMLKKLGISLGRGKTPGKFDEEAWTRWVNGLPAAPVEEPQVTCYDEAAIQEYVEKDSDTDIRDLPSMVSYIRVPMYDTGNRASICSGRLGLEGGVYDILQRIGTIIGNKNVRMTISWELKED